jgi:hypothetical protein
MFGCCIKQSGEEEARLVSGRKLDCEELAVKERYVGISLVGLRQGPCLRDLPLARLPEWSRYTFPPLNSLSIATCQTSTANRGGYATLQCGVDQGHST